MLFKVNPKSLTTLLFSLLISASFFSQTGTIRGTVYEKESVESVLNRFTKNRSHIFIVKDEFGGTSGLVTLEDCIETLLGVEIVDESDEVADMRKLAKDQLRQQRREAENGKS